MKSITIHGIDDELDVKIARKSKEYGLSQNRTVKFILQSALSADPKAQRRDEFSDLFGKWTMQEKEAFESHVVDFERIDESDWK